MCLASTSPLSLPPPWPIGVPVDLCSAVRDRKLATLIGVTPLQLAVRCGAAAAAAALLSAGAAAAGAFAQLLSLATWKSEQLGLQAAATAVPQLVQDVAEALLHAPLHGLAAAEAHGIAAQLAFPHRQRGSPPACTWLLQLLLTLQQELQLAEPAAAVRAAWENLLVCPDHNGKLDVTLAAWLSLPAVAGMPANRLVDAFQKLCDRGMAAAVRVLLALAPVQALLQAEALPITWGGRLGGPATVPLVSAAAFAAARTSVDNVLDAALAAGGAVTLPAILVAAQHALNPARKEGVGALRLLLSRGRPPLPVLDCAALPGWPNQPDVERSAFSACPILATLQHVYAGMDMVRLRVLACTACRPQPHASAIAALGSRYGRGRGVHAAHLNFFRS